MDMHQITKFVSLGNADFTPSEAAIVSDHIEIVANPDISGMDRIMAVCRLSEDEGALVWLSGISSYGTWHDFFGHQLCTVGSSYTKPDKGYLERDVAIYAACKRLGVTRLRSITPPAIPGITGVNERRDQPLEEQPSFDEQAQVWERKNEDGGFCLGYPEFFAELKQRCLEIGAG